MKKILFACASGIATSTVVSEKVMAYLKSKGMNDVMYSQTNVPSVPAQAEGVDLVIATSKLSYNLPVPIVQGLPILTGIGEEAALEKIYQILKG